MYLTVAFPPDLSRPRQQQKTESWPTANPSLLSNAIDAARRGKKKVPRQRAKTQRTRLHPTCRRGRCALAGQSTRHAPGHRYVRGKVYPLGFVSRIWGKMQDSIIFMAIWLLSYLRLPFHIVLPSRSLLGMSLLVALLRVQDAQNGKKQVDDIEVQRNGRRNLLLHMVVPHNHLRVQQNVA